MQARIASFAAAIIMISTGLIGAAPAMARGADSPSKADAQHEEVEKALSEPGLVSTGERLFVFCQGCHMIGKNAARRVGPPLNGVVGRAAAQYPNFPYSPAMKSAETNGLVWTVETLDRFLTSPREVVPGTAMGFAGIPKPENRKALIAYLASFSADGSRVEAGHK